MTPNAIRYWLNLITAAFLTAHAITQVGIYGFGADKHWLDVLNMDRELNLPTLFSGLLLLMAAVLLQRLSNAPGKESAEDWTLLSRIFLFLALDEALQIHEILILPGLRHQVHPALASTWVIPYGLIAGGLLWRFRHFLSTLSASTSVRFLRSGGVYVAGAIGLEMVGSFAVRTGLIRFHSFWYGTITGLEELLEILGVILFLHALMQELLARSGEQTWVLQLKEKSTQVVDKKKTAPNEAA